MRQIQNKLPQNMSLPYSLNDRPLLFSAPTVTGLYDTMYNTTDGINIFIIIIMQLFLYTILKDIYI